MNILNDPPCSPAGRAAIDPPLVPIPFGGVEARLGFPSPAEDFEEDALDLNRLLIRNAPATYIYRASGHSMTGVGILDGDMLIVDRSIEPRNGDLVMAVWEGNQPTCKILVIAATHIELHSGNSDMAPIIIEPGTEVELFAVFSTARLVKRTSAPRSARR